MSVSPWDSSVESISPDGQIVATIEDANEVAMGAPTRGQLVLSNGVVRERCNPSIVWSDDSEYLAVPQWTPDRMQRLMIISVSRRESRCAPGIYDVLQLESFEGGVVRGTDSPIHLPRRIAVDVSDLWR
ncbi:MAG: hypothetical protein PVH68_17390 [Armatimonadota bacterium]|jgi:hypothetical protein